MPKKIVFKQFTQNLKIYMKIIFFHNYLFIRYLSFINVLNISQYSTLFCIVLYFNIHLYYH